MEPKKKIIPIKSIEVLPENTPDIKPKEPPPTARFIFQYALILLFAALAIVSLSYLSRQQSIHAEFSVSALQSLETLQRDNVQHVQDLAQARLDIESLTNSLTAEQAAGAETRAQLDEAKADIEAAQAELRALSEKAERQRRALEYLWRIESLVSARRYNAARALLVEMREAGAPNDLPADEMDGMETLDLSPTQAYQQLVELLME